MLSIAVYCVVFIKSIIDGRYINNEVFNTKYLIEDMIFFFIFTAFLTLIKMAFCKLKLMIAYIIFSISGIVFIIAALASGGGGSWISFEWYYFLDVQYVMIIFIFSPVILVISLFLKLLYKNEKS